MEGTGQLDANFLQDRHTGERFRVVDAGNGMVALHNYHWNRYVRMIWNGQQHAVAVSSVSPDDARIWLLSSRFPSSFLSILAVYICMYACMYVGR